MTTEIPPKIDRPPFDPVSISSLDFWARSFDEREKAFKILRDESPVSWHHPIEGSLMEPEIDGVWVVTRQEDVSYVSKNPEIFCSGQSIDSGMRLRLRKQGISRCQLRSDGDRLLTCCGQPS